VVQLSHAELPRSREARRDHGDSPPGPGGSAPGAGDGGDRPRPTWYAPRSGRWGDWVAILHPPYTAWHLSYVLIGAALAPHFHLERLLATLLAFALAVGVGAHGLDELKGRPLRTSVPAPLLGAVSALAVGAAVALGIVGVTEVGLWLVAFIVAGVLLVVSYNLEIWGGRLHNGTVFALGWGSFPVLTAYYAQTSTVRLSALAAAAFAFWLSRAQRSLSGEARELRRRVSVVTGERRYLDGTARPVSRASLLQPVEQALVALSWGSCLLGAGLVLARTGH